METERKQIDYKEQYYLLKDRNRILLKELTTFRRYGNIVRAIKYILAYNEHNKESIFDRVKQVLN
jgi:hypothetical protein